MGSLVFPHVVVVVRGRGQSSRLEGGMRGWLSLGCLAVKAGVARALAVSGAAAFSAGFVPDDAALTLVIGPEPALAVQALVHDEAHVPSSAPPQPAAPRRRP